MKISDTVDLKQVRAAHAEWATDYYGIRGASLSDQRRADLSGANLSGADLSGANLSGADLSGGIRIEVPPRGVCMVCGQKEQKR